MLKLNGVRLIRFEPEYHIAKIYEWYYSGDYQEFFREYPQCPSASEMAMASQGKTFMIIKEDDNRIIGLVRFFNENNIARNFELGILIDKELQKQNFAFNALKIFLNWKFNYCNFYKAKMKVIAKNDRLCNILDKFSAFREGGQGAVLKKESFYEGKFHDVAVYAIFKTDFNQLYLKDFEQDEARLETPILKDVSHGRLSIRE